MNETLENFHRMLYQVLFINGKIVLFLTKALNQVITSEVCMVSLMMVISITAIFLQEINPNSYSNTLAYSVDVFSIQYMQLKNIVVWIFLFHSMTMIGLFNRAIQENVARNSFLGQ